MSKAKFGQKTEGQDGNALGGVPVIPGLNLDRARMAGDEQSGSKVITPQGDQLVKFPTARNPERARQSIPITKEEKEKAEEDNILSLRSSTRAADMRDIKRVPADRFDDLIDGNAAVDQPRQRKETLMKMGNHGDLNSVNVAPMEDEPAASNKQVTFAATLSNSDVSQETTTKVVPLDRHESKESEYIMGPVDTMMSDASGDTQIIKTELFQQQEQLNTEGSDGSSM